MKKEKQDIYMWFRSNYYIVFTPKKPRKYSGRKRFLVSARMLYKYVGSEASNKAICEAYRSQLQKFTIKFRSSGKLEFYSK